MDLEVDVEVWTEAAGFAAPAPERPERADPQRGQPPARTLNAAVCSATSRGRERRPLEPRVCKDRAQD